MDGDVPLTVGALGLLQPQVHAPPKLQQQRLAIRPATAPAFRPYGLFAWEANSLLFRNSSLPSYWIFLETGGTWEPIDSIIPLGKCPCVGSRCCPRQQNRDGVEKGFRWPQVASYVARLRQPFLSHSQDGQLLTIHDDLNLVRAMEDRWRGLWDLRRNGWLQKAGRGGRGVVMFEANLL